VTASGSGVPGRGSSTDDTPRRGIGRQIIVILAIGLVVRLIMAYGLPPFVGSPIAGSGFRTDLDLFRYWADSLAQHGPFGFYDRGFFADYTPGYLYALWMVGIIGSFIGGVGDLIKLPAIITDVVLALVVYRMVLDLGVTDRGAFLQHQRSLTQRMDGNPADRLHRTGGAELHAAASLASFGSRSCAVISAMMATAISDGDTAPIGKPIGA